MRSRNIGARTPVTKTGFAQIYPREWKKAIYHGGPWEMPFLSLGLGQETVLWEKGPPQSRGSVLRGWAHSGSGSQGWAESQLALSVLNKQSYSNTQLLFLSASSP